MYTIGEFSRIAHVSARMLRYYDALGLIHPVCTGNENGYRYYDEKQLGRIIEIQHMAQCGVKLKDIPGFLEESETGKKEYLRKKYRDLKEERKQLDMKIYLVRQEIEKMEGKEMQDYQVILLNSPKQYVYGLKRKININADEIEKLFQDLYAQVKQTGLKRNGAAQLMYLSEEFSEHDIEVEAQVQVEEKTGISRCLPAAEYVSVIHKGKRENIHQAYEAISKWLAAHPKIHVAGPVIERFIVDDHENSVFETGVLFPIADEKKQ